MSGLDERAAIVAWLREEAADAWRARISAKSRGAQQYRTGQKDGLLIAAMAIENGDHLANPTAA